MVTLGKVEVNNARVLRFWFEIDVFKESLELVPDVSASITEDDKDITRYTTASTGEQITLMPVLSYGLENEPIAYSFVSDNPSKIGVDSVGTVVFHVEPAETASAIITITGTQGSATAVRTVNVTLTVSGASSVDVINGGVAGSARKALTDVLDGALVGADPETERDFYTLQDHTTPSYTRNAGLFIAGTHAEAVTCMSPWNSAGANKRAGTAVTKRHLILAAHYSYGEGTVVRFVASDNSVIERTVVKGKQIYYEGIATDAYMVLLDSDLPASITPCKIFPSNFETYLPAGASSEAAQFVPLLAVDFEEKALILDFRMNFPAGYNQDFNTPIVAFTEPKKADRLAFNEPVIVGDSGNPIFGVIGSELWLVSTFWGAKGGPFYGGLVSELNAMISTLDTLQGDHTGYTVTEGDLSSYTNYSQ